MSDVDLCCKVVKRGDGMFIGEDVLSLSDDSNCDDNNVKVTEIARGTGGDDDKTQSRQMNGN